MCWNLRSMQVQNVRLAMAFVIFGSGVRYFVFPSVSAIYIDIVLVGYEMKGIPEFYK